MISFDNAHRAVHYPEDRRFRIWIRPSVLLILFSLVLVPVVIAWVQVMLYGLPHLPALPQFVEGQMSGPHGFPGWVRWSHFFNFLFLMLLIRSGLSILMDHPRLYFNNDCTPGSEWIRFTPIRVPKDRVWTAKDDARYISPVVALPGYRHTVGVARSWHFITVYGFILTGIFFVVCLFTTDQWMRLVPTSWDTVTEAWRTFVYYANFHFPPEPNGFYGYNALQQIAYAATVFVMAPLSIMTGLAMSPALVNRFQWYPRLFGGRQAARSIHFLLLNGFLAFIVVHVTLISITGFRRNMNHIVMGRDDLHPIGMILGFVGIAVVMLSWIAAHYISWKHPRALQHAQKAVAYPLLLASLNRFQPAEKYTQRPHLAALLAEWEAAGAGGLEGDGGGQVCRLPAEGWWAGGESGGAFAGGFAGAGDGELYYDAPLHPGLVGHRGVGRRADQEAGGAGAAEGFGAGAGVLLVRVFAVRGGVLRHAEPGECAEGRVHPCAGDERVRR